MNAGNVEELEDADMMLHSPKKLLQA